MKANIADIIETLAIAQMNVVH